MNTDFRPGRKWLDDSGIPINAHGGGILFHCGTYYWYGQHMVEGEAGNQAQVGVRVYSSSDLYNWRNEGIALSVDEEPGGELKKGCILERPKVLYNEKTGKFVMWFHLEFKGCGYATARAAVAISDKAAGPFRYLGSFRPNAGVWPLNTPEELKSSLSIVEREYLDSLKLAGDPIDDFPADLVFRRDFEGGQMCRDMTLFRDSDGTAYHIYTSENNGTIHVSMLTDDYCAPAGKYVRVLPGGYNEAPAVMKYNGKYYLFSSGCTWWRPNAARLAMADSILGPWAALGNPCIGTEEQVSITFESQVCDIFPLPGESSAYLFMADRWRPENPIDGRYVWLPVLFEDGRPILKYFDRWDLSIFDNVS